LAPPEFFPPSCCVGLATALIWEGRVLLREGARELAENVIWREGVG